MTDEAMAVGAARERITELIRAAGSCTLTTISLDGRLVGRPMLLQRAAFDGELWFFGYARSATVRQLRVNPEVEVSFADPEDQVLVSLSGTARDDHDPTRAAQLWRPELATWFPDGPATPGLMLIAVHVTAARCWERTGRRQDLLGGAGSAPPGASVFAPGGASVAAGAPRDHATER
ncbi:MULTISPECIES: pyridoxamine 5'-phosphate oxidase family protein [Micromonospora]|uniref:pyridoxamine 5'-phosphate oxidase family protein n=1 Tax=Micromonospora TaxID=1873 RepID=UPI000206BA74|nr:MULTISPECIES: pyridoxamine 5'-phosphate oxidase family protein [Micromonospora]AEB46483.1 pyridoxamine 5'-phosphate oxidase-related fmn-binding protein [Micromonospora maris AB-18-032]RUL94234.1 pyridoxamine 5'-phosphate oxidase [Verrucosispora sp. FIM060022]